MSEAQATIAASKGRIAELQQRLAEAERASKRQAIPFAREEHKADPKKPGRKGRNAWGTSSRTSAKWPRTRQVGRCALRGIR